jgi:hypothetical protein
VQPGDHSACSLAGSTFTMRNSTVSDNVTLNEFGAGINISGTPSTTITN